MSPIDDDGLEYSELPSLTEVVDLVRAPSVQQRVRAEVARLLGEHVAGLRDKGVEPDPDDLLSDEDDPEGENLTGPELDYQLSRLAHRARRLEEAARRQAGKAPGAPVPPGGGGVEPPPKPPADPPVNTPPKAG